MSDPSGYGRQYVLVGHEPVLCDDMQQWGEFMGTPKARIVAKTPFDEPPLRHEVSTVFLGLSHGFNADGQPILFETMIFGGEHDGYMARCATWERAEAQHDEACKLVGVLRG